MILSIAPLISGLFLLSNYSDISKGCSVVYVARPSLLLSHFNYSSKKMPIDLTGNSNLLHKGLNLKTCLKASFFLSNVA